MSRFRGGRTWWWGAGADSSWHMSMYRVSGEEGGWGGSGSVGSRWVSVRMSLLMSAWLGVTKGRWGGREKGKIEGRRNAVPFTTLSR